MIDGPRIHGRFRVLKLRHVMNDKVAASGKRGEHSIAEIAMQRESDAASETIITRRADCGNPQRHQLQIKVSAPSMPA